MTPPARGHWHPARLSLVVATALILTSCGGRGPSAAGIKAPPPQRVPAAAGEPQPMPVISRGVPAFAAPAWSALTRPSYANDGDYDHEFGGEPPVSLIYDLSKSRPAQRERVLISWSNRETAFLPPGTPGFFYYNVPRDYTIDVSDAPGRRLPAAPGARSWHTVERVTGNRFAARMDLVDLQGANWVRMRITAVTGSAGNMNANLKLDVQDASRGSKDSWLFLGDSITGGAMGHQEPLDFPQRVQADRPPFFPAQVNAGLPAWSAADPLRTDPVTGTRYLTEFLEAFPAHFVTLNFGTNDWGDPDPSTFGVAMAQMVTEIEKAGRVPVVPLIPWSCGAGHQRTTPALNAEIQQLWASDRLIVHGPDFWTYFQEHPGLLSSDCVHPSTPTGMDTYRSVYALAMLAHIYPG